MALCRALREYASELPRRDARRGFKQHIYWPDYYGAGNLTCVQVAGLGTSDSPTPETGLAKGAFPGNHPLCMYIQVRQSRRQLKQASRASASPHQRLRSLAAALMALRLPAEKPSCSHCAILHAGARMPSIRKEFRQMERPGRGA